MSIAHRVSNSKIELELSASEDGFKLFLSAKPGADCKTLTLQELREVITAVAPVDLHDELVIQDITRKLIAGEVVESRRVAKGIEPTFGRDGKVVWLVRRYSSVKDQEDGSFADFFHLGLFENIKVSQEIGRIYPPKAGKSGRDVFGKQITSKPGNPFKYKIERSVSLKSANPSAGYDVLVSEVAGYVRDENGTISIREELEVPQNVDYSVGHIDFIGSVSVKGDVQKGFNIKARGAIDIRGSVLGENTLASEASISVGGFHQGGDKSVVYAKAGYTVSVAQKVRAEVQGDIVIKKEVLDCSLKTTNRVDARTGKILGGSTWSAQGIEAKILGNEVGLTTELELRPVHEISHEFLDIASSIVSHKAAMATLELHLGLYATDRKRLALLKGEYRDKIQHLIQKYDQIKASMYRLIVQSEMLGKDSSIDKDARISCLGTIHPEIVLRAGKSHHTFKEAVQGPASFVPSYEEEEFKKVDFLSLFSSQINEKPKGKK